MIFKGLYAFLLVLGAIYVGVKIGKYFYQYYLAFIVSVHIPFSFPTITDKPPNISAALFKAKIQLIKVFDFLLDALALRSFRHKLAQSRAPLAACACGVGLRVVVVAQNLVGGK